MFVGSERRDMPFLISQVLDRLENGPIYPNSDISKIRAALSSGPVSVGAVCSATGFSRLKVAKLIRKIGARVEGGVVIHD